MTCDINSSIQIATELQNSKYIKQNFMIDIQKKHPDFTHRSSKKSHSQKMKLTPLIIASENKKNIQN